MSSPSWIDLKKDAATGIETLHAHFKGHAYDPHWHDSYLVGITEQGVQQFHCRRDRHVSTPGNVFLLEPGEIHDGDAPSVEGFTYRTLYIEPAWLSTELAAWFEQTPDRFSLGIANTMAADAALGISVANAFQALHEDEIRIVRETALGHLVSQLSSHLQWRRKSAHDPRLPLVACKAREYLHAHATEDIGLAELAAVTGVDRFRLSRAFRQAYGIAPYAYLIQLRLVQARRLLANGETPAQVASACGFADQSHLGRWFLRVYRLTPADYRKRCTNLPD